MAANGDAGHDYQAHERSYGLFTGLMKWGTIISLIVTAIVVLIIAL